MSEQEESNQIKNAFFLSRSGAIIRCATIMVDSGRKDLAKQILNTTKIDRKKLDEIKVSYQLPHETGTANK